MRRLGSNRVQRCYSLPRRQRQEQYRNTITPQELLQRAMPLHQAGRFDQAEPLYLQMLELAPGNYPALHLLGMMRLQQGRLPEALPLIEQALKAQPGAPDTMANYAIVLSGMGRHEDALTALDTV